MTDQLLLIALVAVQFTVHALGWSMAAHLNHRWRFAEGHFAAYWLLLAAGLMLYAPLWPSASFPRYLGDLLIVVALAFQHRGMVLCWSLRPSDRTYAVLLAATLLIIAASLTQVNGPGLRVAWVWVAVTAMVLATVRLAWRNGRAAMPRFSAMVVSAYCILAVGVFAQAAQTLSVSTQTNIPIDMPGHLNIPLAILVIVLGGIANLAQIRLVMDRIFQRLTAQALTDPLTGAVNRRGLLSQIRALHARAAHGGHGYVVLMLDVDHFKAVNDKHGHAEGDQVLRRVAQCLHEGLRVGDVVARWGGEEFCVLLPRTQIAKAQPLAERLTLRIAGTGTPRVTVSIGVAEAHAKLESVEQVIRRADAALYRAKEAGRNQVVVAPRGVPAQEAADRSAVNAL
jgi:diguanylate cyclase (GGDEF)-like protein